jgi:hypothetical protein
MTPAFRVPAPRVVAPTAFVLVNAIAFWALRPGVPDLWAARARASAVGHGVGLGYWFSWFGGSTPGNYSVITPYLCAKLGTETVAALAAVVLAAVTTRLVRNSARAEPAAWLAAFGIIVNLWCGRVPFLLGSALAGAALLFVQRRVKSSAAAFAVLAVVASPVAGAFVCLGLSGVVLTARLRSYRGAALAATAGAVGALITLGLLFGAPGPEPLPLYLIGEIALALALMFAASGRDHLRATLLLSAVVVIAAFVVPNGLGANLARLVLFCLPPVAVALSRRPARAVALLLAPIVVLSALSSVSAIRSAAEPASVESYYAPLANELDALPALTGHRVELVSASHAAYAALLDHAVLARGWETQQDSALNGRFDSRPLNPRAYRGWLDQNAVGFVALNVPGNSSPEARLLARGRPGYLRPIWRAAHWELFAVTNPAPIVGSPAVLAELTQSRLTVHIPCACGVALRVRWSKFLTAGPRLDGDIADSVEDSYEPVLVRDDRGWTTLQTSRAGTYVLTGSV